MGELETKEKKDDGSNLGKLKFSKMFKYWEGQMKIPNKTTENVIFFEFEKGSDFEKSRIFRIFRRLIKT